MITSDIVPFALSDRSKRILLISSVGASVLFLLAILVRCAWQADDAFITWRTVENLVSGHGLRWNTEERVQSFTSPLWLAVGILCRVIGQELYFSILVVAIIVSVLVALMMVRAEKSNVRLALAAVWTLIASKAFVDYSVSGLENPMLGLLSVGLVFAARRGSCFYVSLMTSLLVLTRPDALLLALPALIVVVWRTPSPIAAWRPVLLGSLPLVIWEAVSLVYYGSLIPNTALAKLNLALPRDEILAQGAHYVADSFTYDPVTLLVVGVCVIAAGWLGNRRSRALVGGVLLYGLYVVWIGGDFMSGRFWFAPLVQSLAVVMVFQMRRTIPVRAAAIVTVALVAYCFAWPHSSTGYLWRSVEDQSRGPIVRSTGIADERRYYYPTTGLVPVMSGRRFGLGRSRPIPPYKGAINGRRFRNSPQRVTVYDEVGYFGYFAGPEKCVVDIWALSDPLLARIPFKPEGGWRIGHYPRRSPEGYMESRASGSNMIVDPLLRSAYDDILLVTRGDLWTAERWAAIWRLNTGRHSAAFKVLP